MKLGLVSTYAVKCGIATYSSYLGNELNNLTNVFVTGLSEIPFPDENALVEILKIHTRSKPLASDDNLKELSREIKGFSGADVELLCQRASLIAIRKHLKKGKGILKITRNHFEEALNEMAKINGFIFPKHYDPGRTSGTHQSD